MPRWQVLAVASLFIAGVLIRVSLYFPLAMYQIDSDAVIAGLCGFRVLDGHHPIFLPGGVRVGAASCYAAAWYFHMLGIGRVGLACTGLTWSILYLGFSLLFVRAVIRPAYAPIAFVFAVVPPEQFMTVAYAPWGYGEIMALCAAILWLAAEWHARARLGSRIGFGLCVGLGVWFSVQTLMITIPAILWILAKRRRAFFGESVAALPSALLGALPYVAANATTGFPSLTDKFILGGSREPRASRR